MYASRPIMRLYVCRDCIPKLARTTKRAPLLRHSSTLSSSSRPETVFTSFFFNNQQWTHSSTSRHSPAISSSKRPLTQLLAAQAKPETLEGSAYRESEVLTPRRLLRVYAQLSKTRLTTLVVLTAMSGVALSPLPATIPVLLSIGVGTALCSASANTLNQMQEIPFDAQMARTRMRPLVRRAISPLHAAGFAFFTGVAGPVLLWTVNPVTAILGVGNILLYAGAYTWLKRRSVVNTWVGAVVGSIPPLMGWTACGGQLLPSESYPVHLFPPSMLSGLPVDLSFIDNPLSAFALFMVLFSWQFPHFNSLSHLTRGSYAQAGYHMLSVINPAKNALVSLRHSLLMLPLCSVLVPLSGLTTWTFAITSLVPNAILAKAAWQFWRTGSEKQARALWNHSLWYLPVLLGMMMFHKQGMDLTSWVGLKEDEKKANENADQAS